MTTERLMVFEELPPSDDYENKLKWNLFLCLTNFNINKTVVEIINEVVGVEAVNVLTRYKMKIAIAPLFDEEEVKENIQDAVYASFEKPVISIPKVETKTQDEIFFNNLKQMNNKYKYFATVFIKGENPETRLIIENDEEEANRKLGLLLSENKESKVLKTWN